MSISLFLAEAIYKALEDPLVFCQAHPKRVWNFQEKASIFKQSLCVCANVWSHVTNTYRSKQMIECHGIQKNDKVVLYKDQAWHGLGTVLDKAPTVGEALSLSGLDWDVIESTGVDGAFECEADGDVDTWRQRLMKYKMLARSDDMSALSIVGANYEPFQNRELAELCYEICGSYGSGDDDAVKVESAGSLWGGNKVWFLLQAKTISGGDVLELPGEDLNVPFYMVSNSHDGSSSLSVIPTYVRVVCHNTFTLAMTGKENRVSVRHTRNMRENLAQTLRTIGEGQVHRKEYETKAAYLAGENLSADELRQLWTRVYCVLNGTPESAGKNKRDEKTSQRAIERAERKMVATLAEYTEAFDKEMSVLTGAGRTVWTGYNAITNVIEHKQKVVLRGTVSELDRHNKRMDLNLFGKSAKQKRRVLDATMGLVETNSL